MVIECSLTVEAGMNLTRNRRDRGKHLPFLFHMMSVFFSFLILATSSTDWEQLTVFVAFSGTRLAAESERKGVWVTQTCSFCPLPTLQRTKQWVPLFLPKGDFKAVAASAPGLHQHLLNLLIVHVNVNIILQGKNSKNCNGFYIVPVFSPSRDNRICGG